MLSAPPAGATGCVSSPARLGGSAERTGEEVGTTVRVIIAYYSLTGYTGSLAKATAEALDGHQATLLEVLPAKPYSYFTAGIRGVAQAMAGTMVELTTPIPESAAYDALIVYSPTWGWMSSPPVRSFVAQLPAGGGRTAVVGVTHAGGPIGSFDRLAGLVRERGYRVAEALSVFCYSSEQIRAAAEKAAAVLDRVSPPAAGEEAAPD
jgi:flavodoxin